MWHQVFETGQVRKRWVVDWVGRQMFGVHTFDSAVTDELPSESQMKFLSVA